MRQVRSWGVKNTCQVMTRFFKWDKLQYCFTLGIYGDWHKPRLMRVCGFQSSVTFITSVVQLKYTKTLLNFRICQKVLIIFSIIAAVTEVPAARQIKGFCSYTQRRFEFPITERVFRTEGFVLWSLSATRQAVARVVLTSRVRKWEFYRGRTVYSCYNKVIRGTCFLDVPQV